MRMVDALTRVSDEGRNRLRKASGSCLVSFDPRVSECVNTPPKFLDFRKINWSAVSLTAKRWSLRQRLRVRILYGLPIYAMGINLNKYLYPPKIWAESLTEFIG